MYQAYFGLTERPFSIAPDPQYLYMSSRHQEAMAHLSYGLTQGGCFIVLTGEVGTGKTTLCRNLLGDLPENLDVALILNANINERELLQTICDELKIDYQNDTTQKQLLDLINHYLLETFSQNRHTVLIIDEAQLLSRDVLEQIRLLTNLETTKSKLLQIILIGQPELNDLLSRNDLRQLAQRVTARYHLGALRRNEIEDYIHFRLSVAGCKKPLFSKQALNRMHSMTEGIPRRINVLADHALLAAYSNDQLLVDAKMVKLAAKDVFIESAGSEKPLAKLPKWALPLALLALLNIGLWWFFSDSTESGLTEPPIRQPTANVEESNKVEEPTQVSDAIEPSAASNQISEASVDSNQQQPVLSSRSAVNPEPEAEVKSDPISPETTAIAAIADPRSENTALSDTIQPGLVIVADELLDATTELPPSIDLPKSLVAPSTAVVSGVADSGLAFSNAQTKGVSDWQNSDFAQLLETSADVSGGIAAARQLARIWQFELPEQLLQSACEVVKQNGLRCISFSSIEKLQNYNRPAIVALSNKDQLYRVIVESLGPDTAQLRVGDAEIVISRVEFQARWAGDGVLYWRPGQVGSTFLQQGSSGSAVLAVRDVLNRALNSSNMPLLNPVDVNSLAATQFDLDMSQKVFVLQSRFGISGDSKIGNETYILINEIISPDTTPVLRNRLR